MMNSVEKLKSMWVHCPRTVREQNIYNLLQWDIEADARFYLAGKNYSLRVENEFRAIWLSGTEEEVVYADKCITFYNSVHTASGSPADAGFQQFWVEMLEFVRETKGFLK